MQRRWHNLLITLLAGLGVLTACGSVAQAEGDANAQPPAEKPGPIVVPEAPATDPKVVDLLKTIEIKSDQLKTLKARVRYTREQVVTGDQQRRFGDFYYVAGRDGSEEDKDAKSPTRFAILFDRMIVDGKARPMETWFIFDGNWLLERDHEDKTATRRELVPKGAEKNDALNMGDGQIPIPLRLKADKVLNAFHVERLRDEKLNDKLTLIHLKLTPTKARKPKGKKPAPLELWFDSKTLLLYRVKTTEDGDEIEVLLPRPEPNAEIKPDTFNTALPKKSDGWQVQEVTIKKKR